VHKSKIMKNILIALCTLIALAFACGSDVSETSTSEKVSETKFSYSPTLLPVDTTSLWLGDGDASKDTVLIILEGGPKTHLDYEVEGRTSWEYLPDFKNYYRVHLELV